VGVLRKMSRYPVKNHTDPVAVEIVYKVHKFLGRAVTGCRGKISRDLVAPRAVKGVLGDSHELHMCIPHLLYVGGKLMGRLRICIESVFSRPVFLSPGAEMYLVDAHGLFCHI